MSADIMVTKNIHHGTYVFTLLDSKREGKPPPILEQPPAPSCLCLSCIDGTPSGSECFLLEVLTLGFTF